MLIGATCVDIENEGWCSLTFPLFISAVGIIACMVCSFVATDIQPVRCEADIEKVISGSIHVPPLYFSPFRPGR